jgi:hypothetical protein
VLDGQGNPAIFADGDRPSRFAKIGKGRARQNGKSTPPAVREPRLDG